MTRAYLALGSNLGNRPALLQQAVEGLDRAAEVDVVAVSRVYETTPAGGPPQPDYLNAVVAIETRLSPRELLELAQSLEAAAERVRRERWGPRSLDVDVLLVGDAQVAEPDLVVPHPRLRERRFVLVPLADVAPDSVVERQDPGPDVRLTEVALIYSSGPSGAGT
ncbi:MAG: 2-amino-4-hydroxy-6-hydroxymethyldihydropteridine diphosphokinase [Acidimicrobiia bacterium]